MNRWTAMEAFVRVVDAGSFSAAARHLHLGQPAVSKMIAQLEKRLGVRLLLRSTHALTPTEAGQGFYERAKRAIEEADEAESAARGANASLSGELRISAATTFARLHVVPRLAAFLAEHPELKMQVILDDRNIDLIEAGIHVALRMGSLEDSALVARKIAQCPRPGGVFIMVGADPRTGWLKDTLRLDERGFVLTGEKWERDTPTPYEVFQTSLPGVFAVGDVHSGSVKRVASAVGEGSVVVQAVHTWLASLRQAEGREPVTL
jgi:DNA-binding transcriptional LysR family regulator